MAKKQAFNPYLPSYEYIPDGEPHVFGDRIYIYGSHDRFNGSHFCLNDYVCYSAPLDDLTDWKYEGVIFRKDQDPRNQNIPADAQIVQRDPSVDFGPGTLNAPGVHSMYAPDVVCGPDGRYYLYYCLDVIAAIAVAVCDTPAGKYEFLGLVKHPNGVVLGAAEDDYFQFDPGVFVDDNQVYLYSGFSPQGADDPAPRYHSLVMRLETDMLTIAEEPRPLLPAAWESKGTPYEGHEFFEASSIRKINGKYYFVYSSVKCHELCYAVSDKPDEGYEFGGTIVSIGDIYLNGRTEAESLNAHGNTHGGIECVNGQWYVFYHRQTNRTQFSRQACAEKIYFDENGRIPQVEITSCGLNYGPLKGKGMYPARIACRLTRYGKNVYSGMRQMGTDYPYYRQDIPDCEPSAEMDALDAKEPIQYITNILDGTEIGYKYFDFDNVSSVSVELRGTAEGSMQIYAGEEKVASVPVSFNNAEWTALPVNLTTVLNGVNSLKFAFEGECKLEMRSFTLE